MIYINQAHIHTTGSNESRLAEFLLLTDVMFEKLKDSLGVDDFNEFLKIIQEAYEFTNNKEEIKSKR